MLRAMTARSLPRLLRRAGLVAACFGALVAAGPASAQGFGWFGNLFGGGQPNRGQPQQSYPGYANPPSQGGGDVYVPRHRARRHTPVETQQSQRRPQRQAPREAVAEKPAPKKDPTAFVYVFGDSYGQFLAKGLDEALADRPDVGVVSKARGSSGIVNQDYYDWPKAIDAELASKDKIDVAVMMIGSNDRQPITEDGKTWPVGSDEWRAIYKRRVMAIDEAFRKKSIPLIWVGAPIAKSPDFADTMAALNDIDRDAAAKTGATYVDTWEAFSDEDGDFAAYGPDINGQTVRLRSADGILFTNAGARKLAHFVEAHVIRDLDARMPAPALPTGQPAPQAQGTPDAGKAPEGKAQEGKPEKEAKGAPPKPAKPEAGPIANLNQMPSAANGELASPTTYRGDDALAKGESAAAPSGRADDARWPETPPKSP